MAQLVKHLLHRTSVKARTGGGGGVHICNCGAETEWTGCWWVPGIHESFSLKE